MLRNHLNYSFSPGWQMASTIYQYVGASFSWVKKQTIGDLHEVRTYREEFILKDLVKRAEEGTNIGIAYLGPPWLKWTPQLVVVLGSRENLMQVTDYGEKNKDAKARAVFNIVDFLTGTKSIISLQGPAAIAQKKLINEYLQKSAPIDETLEITKKRFNAILDNWDPKISCEHYFSYLAANLIGESVMGIPELDLKHIPLIRNLSEVVLTNDLNSNAFKKAHQNLIGLSQELIQQFSNEIFKNPKFLSEQSEIKNGDTPEEKLDKLSKMNIGIVYIVESNLSASFMMALLQIQQNPDIKKRIIDELIEAEEKAEVNLEKLDSKMLAKLPFLDCVTREVLRFLSPTGLIPRETGVRTTLNITNKKNEIVSYEISAGSRLFAPICAMHQSSVWKNPTQFDPDRFNPEKLIDEQKKNYHPFSTGARSCPAANKFVPAVMKKFIVDSLFYEFQFDSSLTENSIPSIAVQPRWKKDHFLTCKPVKIAKTLKELHDKMHKRMTCN